MKEYKISYIDQTERTKATNNTTHQPDKNGPDNVVQLQWGMDV